MSTWKIWLHGLGAAVISAAASGITLVIVDPNAFNFSGGGVKRLGSVCAVQALIAAAAYLKQSPIPPMPAAPPPPQP